VQENADAILVRVVPSNGFTKQTAGKIVSALQKKGADLEIEVEVVNAIPVATLGKSRFVINNMGTA